MHKLTKGIEYINKMYSRKEESVAVIKSLVRIAFKNIIRNIVYCITVIENEK